MNESWLDNERWAFLFVRVIGFDVERERREKQIQRWSWLQVFFQQVRQSCAHYDIIKGRVCGSSGSAPDYEF